VGSSCTAARGSKARRGTRASARPWASPHQAACLAPGGQLAQSVRSAGPAPANLAGSRGRGHVPRTVSRCAQRGRVS
jgi:hypothetical protein